MDSELLFAQTLRTINTAELAVLRHVNRFPVYGRDIISPQLMVCVSHAGTARVLYDMQEVVFRPNEIAIVLPNHILHPIESSPDYDVTILVHSPAFCEDLKSKRLSHDRYKFHRSPSCLLTDDQMAQFMKAVDLLEHICHASLQT